MEKEKEKRKKINLQKPTLHSFTFKHFDIYKR